MYTRMLSTICACTKLRRSARIVSDLYDRALAPSGLSVAQFSLLRLLDRAGPSSLTQFAAASGHDRSTLNRTLGPLEAEGLVESAAAKDRRARIVHVTDKGKAAMAMALPHWTAAQQEMERTLGNDRDHLFTLLDRIEELHP